MSWLTSGTKKGTTATKPKASYVRSLNRTHYISNCYHAARKVPPVCDYIDTNMNFLEKGFLSSGLSDKRKLDIMKMDREHKPKAIALEGILKGLPMGTSLGGRKKSVKFSKKLNRTRKVYKK